MSTDAGKIGASINWLTELPENTQAIVRPALRTNMKATRSTNKPHRAKAKKEKFIEHSHHYDNHRRASASLMRNSVHHMIKPPAMPAASPTPTAHPAAYERAPP